jgi:hypothetical protein
VITPYRKPADGSELPEWEEELNAVPRKVRARVEHTLARVKCWKILRDYRRAASTLADAVSGIATSATSRSLADRRPLNPNQKINYVTAPSNVRCARWKWRPREPLASLVTRPAVRGHVGVQVYQMLGMSNPGGEI